MRLLAPLSASAAVALLTACPCGKSGGAPTTVARLASPSLSGEYLPASDGTFQAVVRISTGSRCFDLQSTATSEVGGVALARPEVTSSDASCACREPTFMGMGSIPPPATEGKLAVRDDTGDVTATVADLFVTPSVAIQDQAGAPLAALPRSSGVYLAFAPANFTDIAEVTVTFTATGASEPAFSLSTAPGGGVVKDGTRWYFEVPAGAALGAGTLGVRTFAMLATTCTRTPAGLGSVDCSVTSVATRTAATAIE